MVRRTSTERRIAETLVDQMMKSSRRKNRKGPNRFSFIPLILVVIMCAWSQCNPLPEDKDASSPNPVAYESERGENVPYIIDDLTERVLIERVVDGDTLIVQSTAGQQRVRLIGANTPETVKSNWPVEPFGPEASEYTKKRVAESGNIATLVADGDPTDRYGRRLAFVYLADDAVSLNEELVRAGLARANLQYKFSKEMKARLQECEDAAKAESLGVHSLEQ